MLISLTVGKVDAGVAVLLTPDKRLIEFPSILLPPNISSGSIVDITVARNEASEAKTQKAFIELQDAIYLSFGESAPEAPVLRCRNATQTSVVLEWDPIQVATADVISLSLFRNGQKAGNIPRGKHSTKISGLAVDTEYTFHLVLRTSAGTTSSEKVVVKTHKMTDLSGITVTPGILPAQLRESLTAAVDRIGAKIADTVRIDTTHFVTTEGRGIAWEKAVEMNIPVVRPEWVEGCERGGRIVGVRQYYLDANPQDRNVPRSAAVQQPQASDRPSNTTDTSLPERPNTALPETGATNGANGTSGLSPNAPTPPAKNSLFPDANSEEGESEEKENEKRQVTEEQKSRVEDQDQEKTEFIPDKNETLKVDSEEDKEEEGQKTPGDASFQDVAF